MKALDFSGAVAAAAVLWPVPFAGCVSKSATTLNSVSWKPTATPLLSRNGQLEIHADHSNPFATCESTSKNEVIAAH
jgi:hypothetical protein